jgi:hypothetical protein
MMGGTVSFQLGFGFAHGLLYFFGAAAAGGADGVVCFWVITPPYKLE